MGSSSKSQIVKVDNVTKFATLPLGGGNIISDTQGEATYIASNAYLDTDGNWRHEFTGEASLLQMLDGQLVFKTVTSGSADAVISWTTAQTIASTGASTFGGAVRVAGATSGTLGVKQISDTSTSGLLVQNAAATQGAFLWMNGSDFTISRAITVDGGATFAGTLFNFGGESALSFGAGVDVIQLGGNNAFWGNSSVGGTNYGFWYNNARYNGSDLYISDGEASSIKQQDGSITLRVAGSGTAGNAISWINALSLSSTGVATFIGDVYTTAKTNYSSTATLTGWSGTPGTLKVYYRKLGNMVDVWIEISGTSNATTTRVTLPFTSTNDCGTYFKISAVDNGSGIDTARGVVPQNTAYVDFHADSGTGGWTSSGTKGIYAYFRYEAA